MSIMTLSSSRGYDATKTHPEPVVNIIICSPRYLQLLSPSSVSLKSLLKQMPRMLAMSTRQLHSCTATEVEDNAQIR